MAELKISESTKVILDQYQADIKSAEVALAIARKAGNDILNIILFEAGMNPNHIEHLQVKQDHLSFDLKKPKGNEHEVDFKVMQDKDYEELGITKEETDKAINNIPND